MTIQEQEEFCAMSFDFYNHFKNRKDLVDMPFW